MFAHRRSVALIALNHWLKTWPTSRETAAQAIKVANVQDWVWIENGHQWEYHGKTKSGYVLITQVDWCPVKKEGYLTKLQAMKSVAEEYRSS